MNPRILIGFGLAFAIGAICRMAGVPVPAPPAIIGASLVVAMTLGFVIVDNRLGHRPHTQSANCAGPTGETTSAN